METICIFENGEADKFKVVNGLDLATYQASVKADFEMARSSFRERDAKVSASIPAAASNPVAVVQNSSRTSKNPACEYKFRKRETPSSVGYKLIGLIGHKNGKIRWYQHFPIVQNLRKNYVLVSRTELHMRKLNSFH